MRTVFISDGHLKGPEDKDQRRLVEFLGGLDASTLVILGDLFEFYSGSNRTAREKYSEVLDALLTLKRRGCRIVYLEGNHDFSLGPFFTRDLGATISPDSLTMELGGKRFCLAHGDTVSMTSGYALWRGFLRSPAFGLLSAILPDRFVWDIAMRLSNKSRRYGGGKREGIDAALREFAAKRIREGVECVVMGHSHAPGVHRLDGGTYANPGSWAGDGSYLVYEDGRFRVERF